MRPWPLLLLLVTACAPAMLLTKADVAHAKCEGTAAPGTVSVTCSLNQLVPTERLRIAEIRDNVIVLVGEKADVRQKRVPGITTPLTVTELKAGTYAIVLRTAEGEMVKAGDVVVPPASAGDRVYDQATDVYGHQ